MTNITQEDAQRLINQLDTILGDREQLFRTAYELGFNAGHQVGHALAKHEEAAEWARVAEHVHGLGTSDSKSHAEMEQRRWGGPREDFGRPRPGDYLGGPVDWDTNEPAAATPVPTPRDPWATLPQAPGAAA